MPNSLESVPHGHEALYPTVETRRSYGFSITNPDDLNIASFPIIQNNLREWADVLGQTLWHEHDQAITNFLKLECPSFKDALFCVTAKGLNQVDPLPGWSVLDPDKGFIQIEPYELPDVMVFDAETIRKDNDSPYLPFLACVFGNDGKYYFWLPLDKDNVPKIISFPPNRIVIGHNSIAYDRRLLSCEYHETLKGALKTESEDRFTLHVDTFCMATMVNGLSNQQKTLYEAFKNQSKGKGVPEWFTKASKRDLASLAEFYGLGKISKTVRDEDIVNKFEKDYNFHALPKTIIEYCAQDVTTTFKLAQKLYPLVNRGFIKSPITWWGMQELSQSKFHLRNYDEFLVKSESDYQAVLHKVQDVIKGIAATELMRGSRIIEQSDQQVLGSFSKFTEDLKDQLEQWHNDGFLACDTAQEAVMYLFDTFMFSKDATVFSRNGWTVNTETLSYGQGWKTALSKGGKKLKDKLIKFFDQLVERELKALEKKLYNSFPESLNQDLDWTRYLSGDRKGQIKWASDLAKDEYAINRTSLTLLRFRWKGDRVYWESVKTEKGTSGGWRTTKDFLPHPQGGDNLLNNPLCKDYLQHIASRDLTSEVLDQDQLLELHGDLNSISQWVMFRNRLNDVYRLDTTDPELQLSTGDIVPAGTVTRRVTSPVWQVSPKPSKKIGSGLMNHVSVPKGFNVVGTDFDQEESWMATVLTDAKAGKIGSNPWCQAVLDGDKELETDDHSLTAKTLGIPRKSAKNLNFSIQYGSGVAKFGNSLSISLKKPVTETLPIAASFAYYKKGDRKVWEQLIKHLITEGLEPQKAGQIASQASQNYKGEFGVQRTTFEALSRLADTPNVRTAVLNVLIPNPINKLYLRGSEFFTTRNNWQIQSACVDVLHILLTLIRVFSIEYEVDYWFILAVHDSVFFSVRNGHEQMFEMILQKSHKIVKQMAYQESLKAAHPNDYKDFVDFECPENQFWFSEIKVGKTIAESI